MSRFIVGTVLFSLLLVFGRAQQCGILAANRTCASQGSPACCGTSTWCGYDESYCSPGLCQSECLVKPPSCGDLSCNGAETCSTCPRDCGQCSGTSGMYTTCNPSYNTLRYVFTFGGGPTAGITPYLLDILKDEGVKATFFAVGSRIVDWGGLALVQRAVAEGHLVLHQSFSGEDLSLKSKDKIREDLLAAEISLRKATCAASPRLFRPPFGNVNSDVIDTANNMGYRMVGWNMDSQDYQFVNQPNGTAMLVENVKKQVDALYPKSIIHLQQELFNASVTAVRDIIQYVKLKGYQVMTLEDCIRGPTDGRDPAEQYPWDYKNEPNSKGCYDQYLNLRGGANCTSDAACYHGVCNNGTCSCSSGYTCQRCTTQLSTMTYVTTCPAQIWPVPGPAPVPGPSPSPSPSPSQSPSPSPAGNPNTNDTSRNPIKRASGSNSQLSLSILGLVVALLTLFVMN